jgi:hypothetical protein
LVLQVSLLSMGHVDVMLLAAAVVTIVDVGLAPITHTVVVDGYRLDLCCLSCRWTVACCPNLLSSLWNLDCPYLLRSGQHIQCAT